MYNPGDIVHVEDKDAYYFIEGTCLGGEGQRDVVAVLFADDQDLPACEDADGEFERREVHHVPLALFEAALQSPHVEVYEQFEAMKNPVYD